MDSIVIEGMCGSETVKGLGAPPEVPLHDAALLAFWAWSDISTDLTHGPMIFPRGAVQPWTLQRILATLNPAACNPVRCQ